MHYCIVLEPNQRLVENRIGKTRRLFIMRLEVETIDTLHYLSHRSFPGLSMITHGAPRLFQRDRWNHLDAVKRHFQLATDATAPGPPVRETLSRRKDAEITRLQEELDTANQKIRQLERHRGGLSEGQDWTWHDTPDDFAAAMLRLYPDKAKRLGAAARVGPARIPRHRAARQLSAAAVRQKWPSGAPSSAACSTAINLLVSSGF
jgi:hypothetical protein